jgi:serine/threonine-protein phosphatase PGAM5
MNLRPRRRFALTSALATAFALAGAATLAAAAPRTLVLVRHGYYDADAKADPRLGPGLTPLGVAQARLAGARLAGLPFRFDAVLASPLTRAQETARVIASDLAGAKIETVAELEECTPPTWRIAQVAEEKPEEMAACAATLDALFAARFVPSPDAERHDLLVAHGNVIRYLVTKALRVETKAWLEMSVGHASLTTIRVEADGTFKVIAVGDVGHLPPNLQTGATGMPARDLAVPKP